MSRPLTIRKPNADELHQLHQWLEQPLQSWQRRRAEVLLLYAADGSVSSIAQLLQVHRNTVSTDLREFARHGLAALSRPRKLGAPPRLSKQQIAAIWRLADQAPTTLGLPFGRWSLAKLRVPHPPAHCPHDQPRAPAPGAEKRGYTLRRVRRKLFSTDPNRHLILHRLRTWWHNRPRGAILAFFDVQPITVKAYGGRRYTRAKRLVLRRNQKTRGRFYLFLLYEVNQGRVHWAFYPGKGAKYVCRFLRRVRRWYPRQVVRIGLDRDPAHPIKARMTRRTMRQLRLHWTSMPKGSPDDNPAETIFSDIQQNILDNSDDPDEMRDQRSH